MENVGKCFKEPPVTNPSHGNGFPISDSTEMLNQRFAQSVSSHQNLMSIQLPVGSSLPSKTKTQKGHDSQKEYIDALPCSDLPDDHPLFYPVRELLTIFNGGHYMNRDQVISLFRDFSTHFNLPRKRPYARKLPALYYFLLEHLHEFYNFLYARQQGLASKEQENQSQKAQSDSSNNQFESCCENLNDNLHAISPISSSGNSNAFPNDNIPLCGDQNDVLNDNIPLCGDQNDVLNDNIPLCGDQNDVLNDNIPLCGDQNDVLNDNIPLCGDQNDVLNDDFQFFGDQNDVLNNGFEDSNPNYSYCSHALCFLP